MKDQNYPHVYTGLNTQSGAACLCMIAKHYGINISFNKARKLTQTTEKGTNLLKISNAAEKLNFAFKALNGSEETLKEIDLPAIAHVFLKDERGAFQQYIVLYEVGNDFVVIGDPSSPKIMRIPKEYFIKVWSNIIMVLLPKSEEKIH